MNPLRLVDKLIDSFTMYRLLRYYLAGLLLAAFGLSFLHKLPYNPWAMVACFLVTYVSCRIFNVCFGWLFRAPLSSDSSTITAFILSLIITPLFDFRTVGFLVMVSLLAMASKFVLAINRQHIFNPAAVAVLLTAFGANQTASWWIGSAVLLPFVLVGGLLLARKLRSSLLLISFFITTAATSIVWALPSGGSPLTTLQHVALSSPMFFLGFVMLTEPMTMPPSRRMQALYGGIVGFLLPPQAHILNFYTSPELALVIGNVFSYIVSPKAKLFPILKDKVRIAANSADFVFTTNQKFAYLPGQYMEFTLPHADADNRGDRRYFTLASSPTEPGLRIGVKFYSPGSSFKKVLLAMDERTPMVAARIAGEFTLPKDASKKLAFIAGGIGITPFRSMVTYMLDTKERRDVVMLYGVRARQDVAYSSVFEVARRRLGTKTIYVLSGEASNKRYTYGNTQITPDIIRTEIPDYAERIFYLSGTHSMVLGMRSALHSLGVPGSHIKEDFFPGY